MYFVQVYSKTSTTHYCLAALFTVEAEHTSYNSEYGGNVVMGCRFSSKPANSQNDLKVIWHWMDGSPDQEVIRLVGNLESSSSSKFKGRVKLLTDELKNSWAKIQVLLVFLFIYLLNMNNTKHTGVFVLVSGQYNTLASGQYNTNTSVFVLYWPDEF